ncbi:MAG: S-layer homology domain-containing protein [Chthonomonadales bacterium]
MRKFLPLIVAILSILIMLPVFAQDSIRMDPFKDADPNHWAQSALDNLQKLGILTGYPDGFFRGRRTMTRYELAVAVDRMLKLFAARPLLTGKPGDMGVRGTDGRDGATGVMGPRGERGDSGLTPQELATFRQMTAMFKEELTNFGQDVKSINSKLDTLAKDTSLLNTRLDAMPHVYGGGFFGVRSDRSNGGYIDVDGHVLGMPGSNSLVNTPGAYGNFVLGVTSPINGGGSFDGRLVTGNYLGFVGGFGAYNNNLNTNPPTSTYIDIAKIAMPFHALGPNGHIDIGRIPIKGTSLTFYRPDTDKYFDNPFVDDGMYRIDGANLTTNFGKTNFQLFGGLNKSVTATDGFLVNSPIAGASTPYIFGAMAYGPGTNVKPFGQPNQGQMLVDQTYGANLTTPFTLFDHSGNFRVGALGLVSSDPINPYSGFSNVFVPSAGFNFNLCVHSQISGEWAKSITGTGRFNTVNPYENNAFLFNGKYSSGPVSINAGYKYIDPLFYAPGYWGRIGNWINPTNIQGPTVRAAFDFTPTFEAHVEGDFFSAARNRAPASLGVDDDIHRIIAGLQWDVRSNTQATIDWEGVYWNLANSRFGGSGSVHPTENYLNLGVTFKPSNQVDVKFLTQFGNYNGHNALNTPAGFKYNFNTFTGSVAVKF